MSVVTELHIPGKRQKPDTSGIVILLTVVMLILAPLLLLSGGTGWTWPALVPDRPGGMLWSAALSPDNELFGAMLTSLLLAGVTSITGTVSGLLISRATAAFSNPVPRMLLLFPWIVSPVVAGISMYDQLARAGLAGQMSGVVLAQLAFAAPLSAVVFQNLWSNRTRAMTRLVRDLGGSTTAVWRHVVWPAVRRIIPVCLLQTALFSWLDYGLVSTIGGGRVETVTVRLFALLREGGMNQAAVAALILMTPPLLLAVPLAILRLQLPDHVAGVSREIS